MSISPLEHIVSRLTPLECHICKREKFMLCPNCREEFLAEQTSRCYICNKLTTQHVVCKSCQARSRIRRVWWAGIYKEPLKSLIYQMKYQRKRAYAREMGAILAETVPYLPATTLVIHIPTASKRIRQRSFDQAELIAESFSKAHQLQHIRNLYRTSQVDQIGKKRSERVKQMKDSLRLLNPEAISGQSVLLIDDVLTTGATLEAAATLLRQAGAKHVDAAVVARHLLG